jgi:hypothetical protein
LVNSSPGITVMSLLVIENAGSGSRRSPGSSGPSLPQPPIKRRDAKPTNVLRMKSPEVERSVNATFRSVKT